MIAFLKKIYAWDQPEKHPTDVQMAWIVLTAVLASLLWGSQSGSLQVAFMTLFVGVLHGWTTPRRDEHLLIRLVWSHSWGAVFTGAQWLMHRFPGAQ